QHAVRLCLQVAPQHPSLHSFPTRRSSDLGRSKLSGGGCRGPSHRAHGSSLPRGLCCALPPCPSRRDPGAVVHWTSRRSRVHCGRSEEHMSELQSRENLVCRLLLEKNKRKT